MRSMLKAALAATMIMAAPMVAQAETIIRVTLQLPETHSLGQNWTAFKDIIEEKQLNVSRTRFFDRSMP